MLILLCMQRYMAHGGEIHTIKRCPLNISQILLGYLKLCQTILDACEKNIFTHVHIITMIKTYIQKILKSFKIFFVLAILYCENSKAKTKIPS